MELVIDISPVEQNPELLNALAAIYKIDISEYDLGNQLEEVIEIVAQKIRQQVLNQAKNWLINQASIQARHETALGLRNI